MIEGLRVGKRENRVDVLTKKSEGNVCMLRGKIGDKGM